MPAARPNCPGQLWQAQLNRYSTWLNKAWGSPICPTSPYVGNFVKAYSSPCSTITQIAPDPFGSYGRRAGISLASSEYSWTFSPRTLSPPSKPMQPPPERRGADDRSRHRLRQSEHFADSQLFLSRLDEIAATQSHAPRSRRRYPPASVPAGSACPTTRRASGKASLIERSSESTAS